MVIRTPKRIHLSFVSLVTLLVSIILTGFIIAFVKFYYPFGNQPFFTVIYMWWTRMAYLLCLVLVPLYAWFIWRVLHRYTRPSKTITLIYYVLSGLAFVGLLAYIAKLDLTLFYHWSSEKVAIYSDWKTHAVTLGFAALILGFYRKRSSIYSFLSHSLTKIILVIMVVISLYLANFALLNDNHRYNANGLNFSVVMHPAVQVYYGKAVLINQKTQYGLYAQLLEPIFHLMGGISVFKFSLIMAILICLSLLAIGFFLLLSVHPVFALVGFCATIYFHYFAGTLWPHELYYQYYPIRTIVPTLTLLFSTLYFRTPTQKKFLAMLVFLSLGIIWNLDVGLFAFGAFVIAVSYQYLFLSENVFYKLRRLFSTWFLSGLIFTLVFGAFLLYLRLRYHAVPSLEMFVSAQKLFLSGQFPVLFRLWTIIVLIYLAGLINSVKNLVLNRPSVNHTMIFFTTILGLGIFTYSINNPHDSVLTNCGYPALIVLVLLVHETLQEWGEEARLRYRSLFQYKFIVLSLLIISFLGTAFFVNLRGSTLVRDAITIEDLIHPRPGNMETAWDAKGETEKIVDFITIGDLYLDPSLTPSWVNKANFAARYALPNGAIRDDLLILSNWEYLLYLKAHAKSPLISVNFRHLFLVNEWQSLFDQLKNRQDRYVLVEDEWGLFQGELKNHPNEYIAKIEELLAANYHPIEREIVGDSWYDDRWYPSVMIMYERN
ncbi:MAG: hypothetical protein ABII21_04385 [bacterium]